LHSIIIFSESIQIFDRDPVLEYHTQDILHNQYAFPVMPAMKRASKIEIETEIGDLKVGNDKIDSDNNSDGNNDNNDSNDNNGLWLGYVSTTGVYGNHDGAWVTEKSSPLAPATSKAYHRLAAEKSWLELRNPNPNPNPNLNLNPDPNYNPNAKDSNFNPNFNSKSEYIIFPHVFRLGGIYGPGRSALDTVRKVRVRVSIRVISDDTNTNINPNPNLLTDP
jgi:hypothetical protein